MGYYLDFVFDEPDITHEEVMKRFMDHGATIIEKMYRDKTLSGRLKEFYETHIPMEYDKHGLYIPIFDVSKNESETQKGCWAHLRLSWAYKPDGFLHMLKGIMALAESAGCKVYDGQIKELLTQDNIKKALASYSGGAAWVVRNIGKTK